MKGKERKRGRKGFGHGKEEMGRNYVGLMFVFDLTTRICFKRE